MHWLHCHRLVGSCAVAAAIVRHCRAGLRAWDPNWCAYCGFKLFYTTRQRDVRSVFDLFCSRGRNTCLTIAQELILCHNQIYDIRIFNTILIYSVSRLCFFCSLPFPVNNFRSARLTFTETEREIERVWDHDGIRRVCLF